MGLKLIAFGFNAHGQLDPLHSQSQSEPGYIPKDIYAPVAVATASCSLRVLFAGWSDTLRKLTPSLPVKKKKKGLIPTTVEIDGTLHFRGAIASGAEVCIGDGGAGKITCGFGDHSGLYGVVNSRGEVFLVEGYGTVGVRLREQAVEGASVDRVAVAGNGQVCAVRGFFPPLPYTLCYDL